MIDVWSKLDAACSLCICDDGTGRSCMSRSGGDSFQTFNNFGVEIHERIGYEQWPILVISNV